MVRLVKKIGLIVGLALSVTYCASNNENFENEDKTKVILYAHDSYTTGQKDNCYRWSEKDSLKMTKENQRRRSNHYRGKKGEINHRIMMGREDMYSDKKDCEVEKENMDCKMNNYQGMMERGERNNEMKNHYRRDGKRMKDYRERIGVEERERMNYRENRYERRDNMRERMGNMRERMEKMSEEDKEKTMERIGVGERMNQFRDMQENERKRDTADYRIERKRVELERRIR